MVWSRDPINFGVHPNLSPKRVELEASKLVRRRIVAISSKRAKKNLEKGRGLGHVTSINFGVHPNLYPIRVELETSKLVRRRIVAISSKPAKEILKRGVA